LYTPLNFYHTRTPGMDLPIVALQYDAVELCVFFESLE
jgi:hypothetical protein